ncbi:preprotein translocase subunit SecG [Peptostreptococcus porci]|uniref:Protein-export membrane protein SecG n=1 Tax=Peptostreptococcus porci TaxID=2652282 RepID=A0A6N7XFU2_9FIRM|nr:preprotein translocase subunit SecG [Peptostreptococcus porci]MDD7182743.1 preprotein translocase subunit SecG [Peptostreptococcus porci]MDY2793747.1 preprotein translocase subunit SecG [Peptostreptococcus porci]MDY5435110.1 preprotein translocase subunit SecG [Peptostreptococcus porci]MDY5479735.1 preprotein translocase subunit SecG [Peptostreptococcus porci]MDY5964232.1 preprotein translocase subunit SecG [Peptostreptococcus porci]
MSINNILMLTQLVLSLFLIIVVLPQESKQTQTQVFLEDSDSQAYFKPKGKEAFLKKTTRIIAILFFINAIALVTVMK